MSWNTSVIYHLLIDRFASDKKQLSQAISSTWLGGNIRGIITKLPYLKDLGITTLWISPFCKASSYHGYDVEDYYEVDGHFGTKEDLKELVKKCHERNIKVIADFVPNHCSESHPFFLDAKKNKNSKYRKWFYFRRWPENYLCFLDVKHLPKLNLENKETKDHIIKAAKYWIKETDLDGYRLDHAIGPLISFWKEFTQEIKKIKPGFLTLGEVWFFGINKKHAPTLALPTLLKKSIGKKKGIGLEDAAIKQYESIFSGCLDFTFNILVDDYLIKRKLREEQFIRKLNTHYHRFKKDFLLPTFLDNHDMDRFLFRCKTKQLLKRAAEIASDINQPLIIYYGTEIGMTQQRSVAKGTDIQARQCMDWNRIDRNLLGFYKALISKRR